MRPARIFFLFNCQTPVIWPVLVCAPVLVALAALIPYGAYGQMSKDSIVERLKLIE